MMEILIPTILGLSLAVNVALAKIVHDDIKQEERLNTRLRMYEAEEDRRKSRNTRKQVKFIDTRIYDNTTLNKLIAEYIADGYEIDFKNSFYGLLAFVNDTKQRLNERTDDNRV